MNTLFDNIEKPKRQIDRVEAVMKSGKWLALYEIATTIRSRFIKRDSEAGISARLRDIRAQGHTIETRVRKGCKNLWEYRMVTS